MAPKLRVQYPGAVYHVMSRGDRREDIFLNDVDRQDFLKTLAEASDKNWLAGACLLPDAKPLSSGRGNTQREPRGRHPQKRGRAFAGTEPQTDRDSALALHRQEA